MNRYSKVPKENDYKGAANSLTSNRNTIGNTFQLVDNRVSSSTLTNSNISTTQLKSHQAIANYNSNVVQLTKFNKEQRARKLAANKKKNDGYHTCNHCGFQHSLVHYATFQNRRMGDGQFHIDHIQPASRGGRNNMRNGRVLCGTCNTSRGNRAHVGATGFKKYHALHRKKAAKNYMRRPSKKRR
ncbi:HNH endonuclease [Flavobacterium sp. GN10]|uniref:HNH endonuclease n=1 Tax=Flavobacterium tagetis TaxID=2801336 RepID=A0ABS1KMQ0_9FLAO|nr:HNH endonuclease [Flavobacterium tagetis]MBL0739551.1 HNH endonuclease [Flavobacterium tagetis]